MWWGSNETVCRRAAKWKEMAHLSDLMKLDFMLRQDCVVAEHAGWCCDRCATILKHMDERRRLSLTLWKQHHSFLTHQSEGYGRRRKHKLHPLNYTQLITFLSYNYHICTIKWSFLTIKCFFFFYNKMITVSQYNKLLCYNKKIDCSTINPTHNNVPDFLFFLTSSGSSTFLSGTYLTKLSTCDMDAS